MIRLASYPIARAFTSTCIALLICMTAPALRAAGAPDPAKLEFMDMNGQIVTIQSLKGHPLVVNFWATWCAPCVVEMPTVAAIQKEYQKDGLLVLAISEDEMPGLGPLFFKTHAIEGLTSYFDKDHTAMNAIKGRGLPTTLLIDRNGALLRTIEGPVTEPTLKIQSLIDQLVAVQ